MPTAAVYTFNVNILQPAINAEDADTIAVGIKASQTIVAGTIMGEVTASLGTFAPYASGNADGTQVAKGILTRDVVTDASGNISFGGQAATEWGETHKTVPIFVSGIFRTEDLTGLDATAVTALGRIIEGNTTTGLLALVG